MDIYNLGKIGERKAEEFLKYRNFQILDKNFKCKFGEIDIIAKDLNEIVFIEVKTRGSIKYGEAREAVNKYKKKHIKSTAEFYIMKNKLEGNFIRFDVVEVYFRKKKFFINYIKNFL